LENLLKHKQGMIDVKEKIVKKRSDICLCSSDSPY